MSLLAVQGGATGTGTVTILAPSTSTNRTLTLPDATGTVLSTASTSVVTPAMLTQPLTLGTAQASTSGTSIDFNSIPSWVKRITVMFSGVSTTGTSSIQIQLGTSGGVESTGYIAFAASIQGASASSTGVTTGFPITVSGNMSAGATYSGPITFSLLTTSVFTCSGSLGREAGSGTLFFATGGKTLSGTLDRVRVTTVNGTDTFDAGSINILYE